MSELMYAEELEALAGVPGDVSPAYPQRYCIRDDAHADWALRKIAEARADTEKWDAHFKQQLERIRKENERTEEFFTAALAEYFATVPVRETKTKTQKKYALPNGELILKKQAPEFVREDSVLIPFLQENALEEYVKNEPRTDWAALKKACTLLEDGTLVENSTGMALQGVRAEARPDKFEVKING